MKIPNHQHSLPLCTLAPLHLRKGISLLEVLISIFIITIGVLGVASLLPLATHLANRGATADRASIAGREASHQILIRELNNPNNWLLANGNAVDTDPHLFDAPNDLYPLQPYGAKAFCLDPRGVAEGNVANFPNGATNTMRRVTFRPQPGSDLSALSAAQRIALADEVCRAQDDMDFVVPDDATQLPTATMFNNNNGTPNDKTDDTSLKRYSAGDFSWLATFTRDGPGERYTMSVVVFYRRDASVAEGAGNTTTVTFLSGGYGGGDVRLAAGNATEFAQPGQWVLLSGSKTVGTETLRIFRWYRVVNAGEFRSGQPREVTLNGPDWDTGMTTQATIIPGVIAVFDRTVSLENTNLYQK